MGKKVNLDINSKKIRDRLNDLIKDFYDFQNPNDLYKIDMLTCYISSFSRKRINFELLRKDYKDNGLDKKIVDKVIDRIQIGLDVLAVKKGKERY